MIDKETYKKEIVRMFNRLRDDRLKEDDDCSGVQCCEECALYGIDCGNSTKAFEMIEAVEKWSKEHPPKKYKVSKLEYSILEAYMDLSNCGSVKMLDFPVFNRLHELGYFKGATTDTYTRDYFNNCEVEDNDDN